MDRDVTNLVEEGTIEALGRTNARYFHQLFDEAPIAYHEIDKDGILLRVNRSQLDLLGYSADQMISKPVWQFMTAAHSEVMQTTFLPSLPSREPFP